MSAITLTVVIEGLLTGLVYGLMALGLSVIFGVVRIVNFAHGEFTVAAMYAAFVLYVTLRLDPLIAIVPIAAAFFVVGYGLQRILVNRFIGRPEHQQFILLVGIGIIIVNGLMMTFGPDAHPLDLPYGLDSYALGPVILDKARVYAALAAAAVAAALFAFFRFTRTGTAIRACADNLTGAAVVGLDVRRLYAVTFGLGLAAVGAAGALMVTVADPRPDLASAYTLLAFTIVIVGGLGSMAGALLGGVLIGLSEALAGFYVEPSMKSMFSFGRPHPGARRAAARPAGTATVMTLWRDAPRRGRALAALMLIAFAAAPAVADRYLLSVLILVFYFAYLGQAWNLLMGFAGQLSLGHALYLGLGAYTAAALWVKFGIGPLVGTLVAVPVAAGAGLVIGWLGWRFAIEGVYFALLTIAFAEFTRIGFDHLSITGASAGLFLPVSGAAAGRWWNLGGGPLLFYYVGLGLALAATLLLAWLRGSALGYRWLAVREDPVAAAALGIDIFRVRMIAILISAGMTAVGACSTASTTATCFRRRCSTSTGRSSSFWRRSSAASAPCSVQSSAP
jgi:branched-subunit amino acid ABC-type transport system permease component